MKMEAKYIRRRTVATVFIWQATLLGYVSAFIYVIIH